MTLEEAKKLKPHFSFVKFAESRYEFAGLYPEKDFRHKLFLMIYDEPPTLHIDTVKIESCEPA